MSCGRSSNTESAELSELREKFLKLFEVAGGVAGVVVVHVAEDVELLVEEVLHGGGSSAGGRWCGR